MARVLKPKPEYSCELVDETRGEYRVTKIMPDGEELDPYTVMQGMGVTNCGCYAGLMGRHCRHVEIVDLFIAHDKLGSRHTYCFDRREWR